MDLESIWKKCLEGIEAHIPAQNFATWFAPIKLLGAKGEVLELEVPNRFFLEWVREHYLQVITEALRRFARRDLEIKWRVADDALEPAGQKKSQKEARAKKDSKDAKSKKDSKDALALAVDAGLSPKYNFESFVVGKANELAHAACSAVASHPATKYNPLFIYGGVGLGKTHLLQAIGHKILQGNANAKVCYYTSEKFTNEFINYIGRKKMLDFRNKFRNVDVLLIDDIQFWAGKERTQEEFFHTFNTLYEAHKQIVVTSDQYPKEINGLEDRLRSRFEWGLVADIQPPDTETKIAILKKKARIEGLKLPDDVSAWLASVSGSNIRELEGFLNRVIAVSSLTGQEITLDMSKMALKNLLKEKEEKIVTIEEIQKAVSAYYNVKVSDLKSKRRHKAIALPRQVAMYISRYSGKFSFPDIGSAFGGKDHSTAIHAVKKIEGEKSGNKEISHAIKTINQSLGVV